MSGSDPNLIDLLDSVGRGRANVSVVELMPLLDLKVGGTTSHRYQSTIADRGAWVIGSTCFATHCTVTSDYAGYLAGGKDDYPIMFQEFFLAGIRALQERFLVLGHKFDIVTIRLGDSALPPLEMLSEDIIHMRSQPTSNPPILKDNILIYSEQIKLRRVGVIAPSRCCQPLSGLSPAREPMNLARESVRELALTILYEGRLGMAIQDSVSVDLPPALDISEIAGLGIRETLVCYSKAVADYTLRSFMISREQQNMRWIPTVVISSLADSLAAGLVGYVLSPALQSDEFVCKYLIGSRMRYTPRMASIRSIIAGKIAERALKMLSNPFDSYFSTSRVLFRSTTEEAAVGAILTACYRALYRSYLLREAPFSILRAYVYKTILPGIKDLAEAEDQRLLLDYHIESAYRSAVTKGYESLSRDLVLLLNGRRVAYIQLSAKEVVRTLRSLSGAPGLSSLTYLSSTSTTNKMVFSNIREHRGPYPARESSLDVTLCCILRSLKGRKYGGVSTAGYDWLPAARLFRNNQVTVIGSGHGAIARVAIMAGASSVSGLDLLDDIPKTADSWRSSHPPCIADLRHKIKYRRSRGSFVSTGDWMEREVNEILIDDALDNSVFCIDIVGKSGPPLALLGPLIRSSRPFLVIMRLKGRWCWVKDVLVDAEGSRYSPRWIETHSDLNWTVGLMVVQIVPNLAGFQRYSGNCSIEPVARQCRYSSLGGGQECLIMMLLGRFYAPNLRTVDDIFYSLSERLHEEISKSDGRQRSRDWYSLLILISAAMIVSEYKKSDMLFAHIVLQSKEEKAEIMGEFGVISEIDLSDPLFFQSCKMLVRLL
jgi:hypothetical protein